MKIGLNKILVFSLSIIFFMQLGGRNILAKDNLSYMEFFKYEEELILLKNNKERVLISSGENIEGFLEGVKRGGIEKIDLLVIKELRGNTLEFLGRALEKVKVKKVLLPFLREDILSFLKEYNIEVISMEEGFNHNKEKLILKAKTLNGKGSFIVAKLDNIRVAFLEEEAFSYFINLSNIEDLRLDILMVNKLDKDNKFLKDIIKRTKPEVIIGEFKEGGEIKGIKCYNLRDRKRLRINRILGQSRAFQVISAN